MKKLITLLIVLICCVGTVGAQQTTAGKIKLYVNVSDWGPNKVYFYLFNKASKNLTWDNRRNDGEVTETVNIDGETWYYKEYDSSETGYNFSLIVLNEYDGDSNQSIDLTGIFGDTFIKVNKPSGWTKYNISKQTRYYLINTNATDSPIKLDYSASAWRINDFTPPSEDDYTFNIVNNYAYEGTTNDDKGQFSWNKGNNIYRPNNNTNNTDLTYEKKEDVSFARNQNNGSWNIKTGTAVSYDMAFTFLDWDAATYSISPYFTRTPSATSTGYMTYSYGSNAALPEGVTAYFATGLSEGSVTLTAKTGSLKANAGYMLRGTAGTEYKFYATNVAPNVTDEEVSANLMKPSVSATNVAASTNGCYHYFFSSQPSVAFYRLEADATSAAGRAYLETTSTIGSSASGAKLNLIIGDDETTAIDNVKATTVDSNAPIYNIAGQRVANDYKGIVIQNGRKYVVK